MITITYSLLHKPKYGIMTKALIPLSITIITMAVSACDNKSAPKKEDELKVFTSANKIFYSSDISESGYKKVHALANSDISTLVINSRGGDIVSGMKLGEVVFDKKWNFQVQDYCFSSCEDYIFPVEKTKYISKFSQLGWHRGATQQFDEDIVPKEKDDRERFIQILTGLIEIETAFFEKSMSIKSLMYTGKLLLIIFICLKHTPSTVKVGTNQLIPCLHLE